MMLAVRRVRLQSYSFAVRTFVKVGDPVPVTFMKGKTNMVRPRGVLIR